MLTKCIYRHYKRLSTAV